MKVPELAKRPDYQGDLAYFQTVADLITENPPPKDQEAAVILLGRGGIDVGQPMDIAKLDEAAHKGLARAAAMGPQIMKWKVKFRGTPYPTRWNNLRPGTYGFDYFDRAAGRARRAIRSRPRRGRILQHLRGRRRPSAGRREQVRRPFRQG